MTHWEVTACGTLLISEAGYSRGDNVQSDTDKSTQCQHCALSRICCFRVIQSLGQYEILTLELTQWIPSIPLPSDWHASLSSGVSLISLMTGKPLKKICVLVLCVNYHPGKHPIVMPLVYQSGCIHYMFLIKSLTNNINNKYENIIERTQCLNKEQFWKYIQWCVALNQSQRTVKNCAWMLDIYSIWPLYVNCGPLWPPIYLFSQSWLWWWTWRHVVTPWLASRKPNKSHPCLMFQNKSLAPWKRSFIYTKLESGIFGIWTQLRNFGIERPIPTLVAYDNFPQKLYILSFWYDTSTFPIWQRWHTHPEVVL